jgi:transcriptional regulator with XRE-family HTH domain
MTTAEELERKLGDNLRAVRLARRLTQAEVAERANVALGAVKHLESGSAATTTTLVKVLHALEREDWLDALAPPQTTFNPLELLEAQRRKATVPASRRARRSFKTSS